MKFLGHHLMALLLFGVVVGAVRAEEGERASMDPYINETAEQRDARMRWFREARFGMFIHWGVYTVKGGLYQGKEYPGSGEWIMHRAQIPCAEYREYAQEFNPIDYDPEGWVRLAKAAGMNYIVITAKHHDGFALFDTKVSDWDVVSATPYGKDLMAPLAAACQKHGLKLGFYYSQAQDWMQGGSAEDGSWDPAQHGDMGEYIRKMAVPQVKELLSNYGPVSVLWWDTPHGMTREYADPLIDALKLQPGIIHNNRLGGGYEGDIKTPERHVPGTGLPGDWEACLTMNGMWGYKGYNQKWKSSKELIQTLVDIASKGGNLLLNVGPNERGQIPEESVVRLQDMGRWMAANGESIYGSGASPCRKPIWGRITQKPATDKTTLFLHVFDWSADGSLFLPINNPVKACRLLVDDTRAFETARTADGITLQLNGPAPDAICSVVVLDIDGAPRVTAADKIKQRAKGDVALMALDAVINNVLGSHVKYDPGKDCVVNWSHEKAGVDWTFNVHTPGLFKVTAFVRAEHAASMTLSIAGQTLDIEIPAGTGGQRLRPVEVGNVALDQIGDYKIELKPVKSAWSPVDLGRVILTPMERP
jgi:alpha-L-fucosidase